VKKRLIFGAMVLCMLLSPTVPAAYADETEATEETAVETTEEAKLPSPTRGSCGPTMEWNLENGVLTVNGAGEMDAGCPWEDHKDSIKKVVFTGGVTKVGAESFMDCDNLVEINFGSDLKEIDTKAFYDCDGLTELHIPASFRRFGVSCFQDCSNLDTVYCVGGMPSFNGNCLWNGNQIAIYTPVNNPWPQEHVEVLVNNFGGRLEIMAGSDSAYTYTEPTVAPETTEATVEPTTEPETEPTTEPETEPATVPTEETVMTEPETTAAPETQAPETEPETLVEKAGTSGWAWTVIVAAGVTALLVLALIIRMIIHKDGKYTD